MSLRGIIRRAYHGAVLGRARTMFPFWERHGLHVVRNTYDSPIPDTRSLDASHWSAPSELVGIDVRDAEQLALLREFARDYRHEYGTFPEHGTGAPNEFYLVNGAFGSGDAEILYSMVRRFRPAMVVEVGSGWSTRVTVRALAANLADSGAPAEFTTIDPFCDRLPGVSRHIGQPVERVPLSEFARLEAGDILFIDSPHVVTTGGAVQWLFLEVLPRLNPGVLVHVHDIFLPEEYPRPWLIEDRRFYSEQYLLHAFLLFNRTYEVLWMGNYMHLRHGDALREAIPSYRPERGAGGSFWMRRVQEPAPARRSTAAP